MREREISTNSNSWLLNSHTLPNTYIPTLAMGMIVSGLRSMFPAKSNYTAESVPDLSGQVIIVTGANSGIGKTRGARDS